MDELASQNLVLIVALGVIASIAVFLMLGIIVTAMNYEERPVRDRLLGLKDLDEETIAELVEKGPFDDVMNWLINFSRPLSQKLFGKDQTLLGQVKRQLAEAGMQDTDEAVARILASRVAVGIVGAIAGFSGSFIIDTKSSIQLGGVIAGFLIGSLVPMWILRMKASKRQDEIRYKLPDTLDLMVICVEAGLGLDATINRVARETEDMAPFISQEYRRLNLELNAGIPRMEAFQNLGKRSGVDEMRSLCALIIQSDKLGTSISETLRISADDMRVRRRQRAEELASKASIKMTFPLVLLIFPPLFIVLLGPTVIQAIHTFS